MAACVHSPSEQGQLLQGTSLSTTTDSSHTAAIISCCKVHMLSTICLSGIECVGRGSQINQGWTITYYVLVGDFVTTCIHYFLACKLFIIYIICNDDTMGVHSSSHTNGIYIFLALRMVYGAFCIGLKLSVLYCLLHIFNDFIHLILHEYCSCSY